MKKAYSYAKFSSVGQAQGTSLERQLQITRDWHAREITPLGIPLDESLGCDSGLSAHTGKHIEKGSLGHFLAEINEGLIAAGSILIAENLDRISRQGPKIARKLLEKIVDRGVDVHICNIAIKLSFGWENDFAKSVVVDSELGRAWKESEYKSERIGHSWRSNKRKVAEGRILTKNVPWWLKVVDGKIVEQPERVAVVQEIFRLAALGIGARNITRKMRTDRSLGWVIKTLNNRSVIGEYQPSRFIDGKQVNDGDVILGYYPPVITQSAWDAARIEIARNTRNGRGRGGDRTSDTAANLFTNLLFDVTSEPIRGMNFQRKSGARYPWLISAWDRSRKGNRLRYDKFETPFLGFLSDLDWKSVVGQSESDELNAARFKLETVLANLDKTSRRIAAKTEAMDGDLDVATLKVLAGQIAKDEARVSGLAAERDALQLTVQAAKARSEALYSPEELLRLIGQNDNDVRLRLRAEIRRRISRIEFIFGTTILGTPSMGIEPGTGRTMVRIKFVNGAERMIVIQGDEAVLLWLGA